MLRRYPGGVRRELVTSRDRSGDSSCAGPHPSGTDSCTPLTTPPPPHTPTPTHLVNNGTTHDNSTCKKKTLNNTSIWPKSVWPKSVSTKKVQGSTGGLRSALSKPPSRRTPAVDHLCRTPSTRLPFFDLFLVCVIFRLVEFFLLFLVSSSRLHTLLSFLGPPQLDNLLLQNPCPSHGNLCAPMERNLLRGNVYCACETSLLPTMVSR